VMGVFLGSATTPSQGAEPQRSSILGVLLYTVRPTYISFNTERLCSARYMGRGVFLGVIHASHIKGWSPLCALHFGVRFSIYAIYPLTQHVQQGNTMRDRGVLGPATPPIRTGRSRRAPQFLGSPLFMFTPFAST